MLDQIIHLGLPWWLLLAPGAVAVVVTFYVAEQSMGFRAALKIALAVAGAIAIAILSRRSFQAGYKSKEAQDALDAQEMVNRVNRARRDAIDRYSKPGGLRDNDGFKRDL